MADKDALIKKLRAEIEEKDILLKKKDQEIERLKGLHDENKSNIPGAQDGHPQARRRLIGISAEPTSIARIEAAKDKMLKEHDKSPKEIELIEKAIMDNLFLRNLEGTQIRAIAHCMYAAEFPGGTVIIKEGAEGSHVFVIDEGEVEVTKRGTYLNHLSPGDMFGELAILYHCKRTASVKAITKCKLFAIERKIFQDIMMKTGLNKQNTNINLLKQVPMLKDLSDDIISDLSDICEEESYEVDKCIVRQGTVGDSCFIIADGEVKVSKVDKDTKKEVVVENLSVGGYFGEKALLADEVRDISVTTVQNTLCLRLPRQAYSDLMENLKNIYQAEELIPSKPQLPRELADVTLNDIKKIATLGMGGFGRVWLVNIKGKPYALKQIIKAHVVRTHQQDHMMNEKNILLSIDCPFIIKLYKTFKDNRYAYMLMEVCLGGELWRFLVHKGPFDDKHGRFYTACIIEALRFLHKRGVVYRDLKPENVMIATNGYVKLVDFGFAKNIGYGRKTWTFCGTPEYGAPEVILNKGHDLTVDLWALGVFMFEILTGYPPFSSNDQMKTYGMILKGFQRLEFPERVSRIAQHLICLLCRDIPAKRIGARVEGIAAVKKHRWFDGFNWPALEERKMPAPYVPTVRGDFDTSAFSQNAPPEDKLANIPVEQSGWDADF